jgi:hypothetical protein
VGVNTPNATITSYRRTDGAAGDGRPSLSPERVSAPAWPTGVPVRVAPLSNALRESLTQRGIAAPRLIEMAPALLTTLGIVARAEDRITLTPMATGIAERLRVVEVMAQPAPGIAGRGDLVRLICTPIADGVN